MAAPFDEFSPEVNLSVEGLAWLGHLETEVSRWGHRWVLRTLKADEELQAALVAKEYQDTYGQVKAQTWAHVAAALVAVDGDDNFCPPIGPDRKQHIRAKFEYITENWYWPVGELLFGAYADLITAQAEALEAVDSLASRSLRDSFTSPAPSNAQEDSPDPISTPSTSDSSPISPEQMRKLAEPSE